MTPGRIDLKVVRDRLELVAQSLEDLRALPQSDLDEFTADRRNILAADAALRRGLDAIFDIARHLLARASGSEASSTARWRSRRRSTVSYPILASPR